MGACSTSVQLERFNDLFHFVCNSCVVLFKQLKFICIGDRWMVVDVTFGSGRRTMSNDWLITSMCHALIILFFRALRCHNQKNRPREMVDN